MILLVTKGAAHIRTAPAPAWIPHSTSPCTSLSVSLTQLAGFTHCWEELASATGIPAPTKCHSQLSRARHQPIACCALSLALPAARSHLALCTSEPSSIDDA